MWKAMRNATWKAMWGRAPTPVRRAQLDAFVSRTEARTRIVALARIPLNAFL
jgi:hypothetical protein